MNCLTLFRSSFFISCFLWIFIRGARGETRTRKILILSQTRIPIPSQGLISTHCCQCVYSSTLASMRLNTLGFYHFSYRPKLLIPQAALIVADV